MTHGGSGPSASLAGEALVDGGGNVWLPYDLPRLQSSTTGWSRLSAKRQVRHAGRRPFRWHAPADHDLHILNGMGVTIGDSIIGMNALAWLKERHPELRIHLYRSPHTPPGVERLYQLARHLVEPVTYLPTPLRTLPPDILDLSDFLYWPRFATEPMVDFFLRALGLAPDAVPASAKANRWLSALRLPQPAAPWPACGYVLFCGRASTPLRSVAAPHAAAMVDLAWRRYRLPVLGFQPISHPRYHDISALSPALDDFLAWIRGAAALVATDSSALHIAAGFDVPTLAVFVSIDPRLRARDYAQCQAVDLRCPLTDGLHESDDPRVLRARDRLWRMLVTRTDLPWPAPRLAAGRA